MRRLVVAALLAGAALSPAFPASAADSPFGPSPLSPADYVMEKLRSQQVVLLGEGHWIRHDAELVASLVPRLSERKVALAMETLRGADQETLDRVLSSPAWDERGAMRLMRIAAWPWREYLEIVRAAWEANRKAPGSMRIVALSPPSDWRESLLKAKGTTYDQYMADLVSAEVKAGRKVLVYCGIHHAFTRYQQPELDLAGRATLFMDRARNILRRRLGGRVFLITLQQPVWCGKEPWSYCLLLGGAIDCAGAELGRPVGFDVANSAFAERLVDKGVYYAHGYSSLRLLEMTDGYVWTAPIEEYRNVRLIPLLQFASDEAALADGAAHNPFTDEEGLSREKIQALWDDEEKRRAGSQGNPRWANLMSWRKECGSSR